MKNFADNDGFASVKAVIEHYRSTVIEARILNHDISISFAEQIGLLTARDVVVRLTESGLGFLDLNPGNLYDLSEGKRSSYCAFATFTALYGTKQGTF